MTVAPARSCRRSVSRRRFSKENSNLLPPCDSAGPAREKVAQSNQEKMKPASRANQQALKAHAKAVCHRRLIGKPFGRKQTMLRIPSTPQTKQMIVDQVRAIAPRFAQRAEAAEQARKIPADSVQDMLASGLARVLVPRRFGGYGLDFDTWFDIALEIGKSDASHGWCASLIIHHAHLIA